MVPSYLYKYRPVNCYLERLIVHDEIYFSRPSELNDPYDCNLFVSAVGSDAVRRKYLETNYPQLSQEQLRFALEEAARPESIAANEADIEEFMKHTVERMGIFCTCARNDDLRMWTDYAAGHRGVCLQFKTLNGQLFGCDLTPIVYSPEHPAWTMFDECDERWTRFTLATKSDAYANESEWRILYHTVGKQQFPAEDLSGIIFGCRMEDRPKQQILEWISLRPMPLRIYEARVRKGLFALEIVPAT